MSTDVLTQHSMQALQAKHYKRDRIFFGGITLLMIAAVVLGSRQTWFALNAHASVFSNWGIQLRDIVFSLYLALFLAQVALVSANRTWLHMRLGFWTFALAILMFPLCIIAVAGEIRVALAVGPPYPYDIDPLTFAIVSCMGTLLFGLLLACSYAMRYQPNAHKRLALYATLAMLNTAIDRWPWESWHLPYSYALWTYGAFLLLPVLYDVIFLERLQWATISAAPFIWTLHRIAIPLGQTTPWHAITGLLLHHA